MYILCSRSKQYSFCIFAALVCLDKLDQVDRELDKNFYLYTE